MSNHKMVGPFSELVSSLNSVIDLGTLNCEDCLRVYELQVFSNRKKIDGTRVEPQLKNNSISTRFLAFSTTDIIPTLRLQILIVDIQINNSKSFLMQFGISL